LSGLRGDDLLSRMSASRERQVRLGKKRQRRARRLKAETASTLRADGQREERWSSTVVLGLEGTVPGPEQVAAVKAWRLMSDALLELMEPYATWPPTPSRLVELQTWLELGAAAWNATVESRDVVELEAALRKLATSVKVPAGEVPLELLEEVATRKLTLFPMDPRRVGVVKVWAEGGRAYIEATSLSRLR
jgi:hypothetical protein